MKKFLVGAAALAILSINPASAQILGGGGVGGGLGGTVGGLGGGVGGTIRGTVDRAPSIDRVRPRAERPVRVPRNARVTGSVISDAQLQSRRLGERRIAGRGSASADAGVSLDRQLLRTRGAVAATRRGLRRVAPTAAGVQVFVPQVQIAAPSVPVVAVASYPAYGGGYYYSPGAVFVEHSYVDTYMDRQHQDLETALRGTGATVERRGEDLIVLLPADVTFAFDKADIRPRFYGVLSAFAQTMDAYPGTDVEIVGHTDAVGSEDYNIGLSERRGRAVADYLVARRSDPSRMMVAAMGEAEPVATNATVEGRAANRRVELIIHPRAG